METISYNSSLETSLDIGQPLLRGHKLMQIYFNPDESPLLQKGHTYFANRMAAQEEFHCLKNTVQWDPCCRATFLEPEKWPFKRGGLSSGIAINTFMFRFTLSGGLSREE